MKTDLTPRMFAALRILVLACLIVMAASTRAANPTVVFSTLEAIGTVSAGTQIDIQAVELTAGDGSIVLPFNVSGVTDGAGNYTTTLVPQPYRVVYRRGQNIARFTNCIPDTADTIQAANHLCGAQPSGWAFSQAQSARIFLQKTNAGLGFANAGMSNRFIRPRIFAGLGPTNVSGTSNKVWTLTNEMTGEGEWRTGSGSADLSVTNALVGTNAFVQGTNAVTTNLTAAIGVASNAILSIGWSRLPQYYLYDYGWRQTNTGLGNMTAWTNCMLAWSNGGGGVVVMPTSGRGSLAFTNINRAFVPQFGSAPPKHYPFKLIGQGEWQSGQSVAPEGGSYCIDFHLVLDSIGPSEISGITFDSSSGKTNTPHIYSTFTVPKIHNCGFYGPDQGTNARQDAIVLGFDGAADFSTGGTNASFQGYGGRIYDNWYNRIRTVLTLNGAANNVFFGPGNNVWSECGGNSYMIIHNGNGLAGSSVGNTVMGNTFEGTGYPTNGMVLLDGSVSGTTYAFNGWYDPPAGRTVSIFVLTNNVSGVGLTDPQIDQGFRKWLHGIPAGAEVRTFESGETNYYHNIHSFDASTALISYSATPLIYRVGSLTGSNYSDRWFAPDPNGLFLYYSLSNMLAEQIVRFNRSVSNEWSFQLGNGSAGSVSKIIGGETSYLLGAGGDLNFGWLSTWADNAMRLATNDGGSLYMKGSNNSIILPNRGSINFTDTADPGGSIVGGIRGMAGEVWTVSGSSTNQGTNRAATVIAQRLAATKIIRISTNTFPDPIGDGTPQLWVSQADTNLYFITPDGAGGSNRFVLSAAANLLSGFQRENAGKATNEVAYGTGSTNAYTAIGQGGGSFFISNLGYAYASNGLLGIIGGALDLMDSVSASNRTQFVPNNNGATINIVTFDGATNKQAWRITKTAGNIINVTQGADGDVEQILQAGGGDWKILSQNGSSVKFGATSNATHVTIDPSRNVDGVANLTASNLTVVTMTGSGPHVTVDAGGAFSRTTISGGSGSAITPFYRPNWTSIFTNFAVGSDTNIWIDMDRSYILSVTNVCNGCKVLIVLTNDGTFNYSWFNTAGTTNRIEWQNEAAPVSTSPATDAGLYSVYLQGTATNVMGWYYPPRGTANIVAKTVTTTGGITNTSATAPVHSVAGFVGGTFTSTNTDVNPTFGGTGSNQVSAFYLTSTPDLDSTNVYQFAFGRTPVAGQLFGVHSVSADNGTNVVVITNVNSGVAASTFLTNWVNAVSNLVQTKQSGLTLASNFFGMGISNIVMASGNIAGIGTNNGVLYITNGASGSSLPTIKNIGSVLASDGVNPFWAGDNGFVWHDEFMSDSTTVPGDLNWTVSGSLAIAAAGTGANNTNAFGVIRVAENSIAAGAMHKGAVDHVVLGGATVGFKFRLFMTRLSDATDSYVFDAGLGDSTGATEHTDAVVFRYHHGINANWNAVTFTNFTAGVDTGSTNDTGVTMAVDTWYTGLILVNSNCTSVGFYMNTGMEATNLVNTVTTKIPRGRNLTPMFRWNKTAHVNFTGAQIDRAALGVKYVY